MTQRHESRKERRPVLLPAVSVLIAALAVTALLATGVSRMAAAAGTARHEVAALVGLGGIGASLALAWLMSLLTRARAQADREARERQNAERLLEVSESRLRSLIAQAPLGIQVLSSDGKTVEVNRAYERLWALDGRAPLADDIREEFKSKFPDSLPYLKRAFAGFQTTVPILERTVTDPASKRFVTAHAYPLKDESGAVRELVLLYQDLTDVKRAEEEVRRVNAYLEQRVAERTAELVESMAEMESFSYSVAHDLRTPLRAMGSFAKLLMAEHGSQLSAEAKTYLKRIVENSLRMGELIDGLLDLSRVSRAPLELTRVDVSAIAAELVQGLQRRSPDRNVECVIEPNIVVDADEHLMRAALQNLIENAWKFTGHAPSPKIEIGKAEHEEGTQVFVRDNGVGFDPTYVGKLFRPFERLHSADEFPGTGIGLATVRRIVERHEGRVWAEGSPHRGACFYFVIPKQAKREAAASTAGQRVASN